VDAPGEGADLHAHRGGPDAFAASLEGLDLEPDDDDGRTINEG